MIVLDSTVLIDVLRDRTGGARRRVDAKIGTDTIAITRMTQFEVMRGCRDQRQWERLGRHLEAHHILETTDRTWEEAARIAFDLRKRGLAVRSGIDCVIAQVVIENERMMLHNDSDFETIARVRPLKQERFDAKATR